MTLNLPRRAVAPLNSSEDNLISSISAGDKTVEGIGRLPARFSRGLDDPFDLGRDGRGWGGGSCESAVGGDDILDLLPSDPFGMELGATLTRIAEWIGDFEIDGSNEHGFFPGLNLIRNQEMVFQFESGNMGFGGGGLDSRCLVDGVLLEEKELRDVSGDGGILTVGDEDKFLSLDYEVSEGFGSERAEGLAGCAEGCTGGEGGPPHDALFYALSYLGVKDLLSVKSVCKTMHSAVQNDALLWRKIYIEPPLNSKITDDVLLQLTTKAQGKLQYLNLVECPLITDEGLMHVLESNPTLTKLCVRGCTGLTIEGLVNNLKSLMSPGGLNCLQINGLHGLTHRHYEELKFLLNHKHLKAYKQRFYHMNFFHSCDDECHGIDIENCPRCDNLRPVYDCPVESCQKKQPAGQLCRACSFCISRCVQCGRCINNSEYQETFCLDLLCLACWKQAPVAR